MRRPKQRRSGVEANRPATAPLGAWRRGGLVGLAVAGLSLAGCEMPKEINPVTIYREVSGLADEGRRPPPGLDDPFPNLASVPPRPDRPTAAAREAISAALLADRSDSRDPVVLRTGPGGAAPRGLAAGVTGLPGGPPPRPVLAAAPRVPWAEAPGIEAPAGRRPENVSAPRRGADPATRPGTDPATARPEPLAPEIPDTAPAAPPPDLLSAPPPPRAELLAPQGAPRPR